MLILLLLMIANTTERERERERAIEATTHKTEKVFSRGAERTTSPGEASGWHDMARKATTRPTFGSKTQVPMSNCGEISPFFPLRNWESFIGPGPHRDRDNPTFGSSYLIRTGFTLGEPVFLGESV